MTTVTCPPAHARRSWNHCRATESPRHWGDHVQMTHCAVLSRRLLAVGAAVGIGLMLLPAAPAGAATSRIPGSFFGMHNGEHVSYPTAPVGAVRLWDSGVSWRDIETAPGRYDFTPVDAQVNAARAHGATVLLVLGQTPRFHSTKPGTPGTY